MTDANGERLYGENCARCHGPAIESHRRFETKGIVFDQLSCTDCHDLIRVYSSIWSFSEDFFDFFLNLGHTDHTTDQDNLVDVTGRKTRVFQCLLTWLDGTSNQLIDQALQFGTTQFDVQMFRTCCISSDVRQVDISLLRRRQLDLSLLRTLFQSLKSHLVLRQVNALIIGPGGYKVADFVRVGGGMTIIFLVVMLAVVNLIF